MEPTALDVKASIEFANSQLNVVKNILNSASSLINIAWYTAVRFFVEQLIAYLEIIFIEVATDEIQASVGSDYTSDQLDFDKVVSRHELISTISDLRDNYGVDLTGSNVTLGVWLSDPTSDLSLISTIFQAVQVASQELSTEISGWSDPITGYLRSPVDLANVSNYINSLINSSNPTETFKLVAYDTVNLTIILEPSHYPTNSQKLFGYLKGWDYAGFARRIIQIDWDIYNAIFQAGVASRFWNSQTWLPTSNKLLRTDWSQFAEFSDRGISSIDPVHSLTQDSPYDLITSYRARTTVCTPEQAKALCHDGCYAQEVIDATNNVNNWQWAGTPRTNSYLPFLPKSIMTGCESGRRSLAKGTLTIWSEIGIYQDLEDIARWVNALEHGGIIQGDSQDGINLMQFLHFIYHQTDIVERDVKYIAAMSSAILEFDNANNVDERAYRFLIQLLTPVSQLPDGIGFATVVVNIDWEDSSTSQYTTEMQSIVADGAIRTFGSTEINSLQPSNFHTLVQQFLNSSGDGGWVEFISTNNNWPNQGYVATDPQPQAPDGVFLMTINQFNYAQGLD